ncbi:MAG TPA: cell division protein FtsQ/DivIB [Sphingomicrobium sp.]|nr:cell division protein FtsQ/DivIB [Sphingomicrobium sp.]
MSAAHVRRGASGRSRPKKSARVSVPRKIASKLPVEQAQANRLAAWAFGLFALAIVGVALVALDVPTKLGQAAGEAVGNAGFRVKSVDVQGIKRMDPRPVYEIALDQKTTAMPLVDVADIRKRLLEFGWVKDARVSRRFPDTLVIDIIERKPAALWQDEDRLTLIDAEGVVLDRVPVAQMPDLPLLIGKGANAQTVPLERLLDKAPSLKAQLESATWVGQRRWDLSFQSGETVALPEGEAAAGSALVRFAKMDQSAGLLGRGILRFDLRIPGKMTVRLPREPGDPIVPEPVSES